MLFALVPAEVGNILVGAARLLGDALLAVILERQGMRERGLVGQGVGELVPIGIRHGRRIGREGQQFRHGHPARVSWRRGRVTGDGHGRRWAGGGAGVGMRVSGVKRATVLHSSDDSARA